MSERRHHGDTVPPDFLLERELAGRWRISVRTLQRWRGVGSGPAFLRLGCRIAYRLSDIESFEAAHTRDGGRR
jgi:hypothetical protein